jgi:hypothetical protein
MAAAARSDNPRSHVKTEDARGIRPPRNAAGTEVTAKGMNIRAEKWPPFLKARKLREATMMLRARATGGTAGEAMPKSAKRARYPDAPP